MGRQFCTAVLCTKVTPACWGAAIRWLVKQAETRPDPEMVPAVALLLGAAAAAAAEWKQDRFVISMCNDPIVAPEQLAFRYREMADANFTLVSSTAWLSIGKWDDATRMAHAQTSLRAAEAAGIALIGAVMGGYDNITDDIHANSSLLDSDSPALWGWLLADEPCPREQFYALQRERAQIDAHRPGKLSFVNLLPNYGFPRATLGWDTYEQYVDFFIEEYKPQVLCFDHYPWFEVGDSAPFNPPTWAYPLSTLDGYRRNLATVRSRALANDIPFWNYFNTIPYQSHRDPTFGELCWQVFTSLTFGAKGVLYFTYWDDPDGQHYGFGNSIITRRALPDTYNQ